MPGKPLLLATRCFSLLLFVLGTGLQATAAEGQLPLLFEDDFESGLDAWQTTDVEKKFWELVTVKRDGQETQALRVTGPSEYQPPHRSPHSIALVKDVVVSDFEMTVQAQSTNRDAGPHRDMCLFWGYQDPAHFYYVHLGAKADPHACQIFIVDDAPRTMITKQQAGGTPWTDEWHTVKVVHRVDQGLMEVYFDDMEKPLMTAEDKTFQWGQVGLGTFDDHGNWDEFQLRGKKVEPTGQDSPVSGE